MKTIVTSGTVALLIITVAAAVGLLGLLGTRNELITIKNRTLYEREAALRIEEINVERLTRKLDDKDTQIDDLTKQLGEARDSNAALKTDIEALTRELHRKKTHINDLTAQLDEVQDPCTALKTDTDATGEP